MSFKRIVAGAVGGIAAAIAVVAGYSHEANQAIASSQRSPYHASLHHSWEEEHCRTAPFGFWGSSKKIRHEFSGNQIKTKELYFSDSSCQDLAVTTVLEGIFELGNEIQPNIRTIEVTYSSGKVTVHNSTGQSRLNNSNACQISSWIIGQTVVVTPHSGDKTCLNTALPKQVFDIYSVENNDLILGKGNDKSSPQVRPTELDREVLFHQR